MRSESLPLVLCATLGVAVPGCSLHQIAVDHTATMLKESIRAFETEWDYDLAEAALPASIKMVEGFVQSGPSNPELLLVTAQGYTAYSLAILEDQWERAPEDSPAAEALARRTREMYLRAHRYGLRLVELRHPGFTEAFAQSQEALNQALKGCDERDVTGLFWAGMPLSTAINVSRDDVGMIALLPKAKALLARTLDLDETYYNAGAHMVFGALYGSMGKLLGGDPEASRKHFDRALALTRRRYLMVQVMYAKTLAVQLQDRALFQKLLEEVLHADLDIFPEQKLANVAAKRRARRLLARAGELF